MTVLKKLAPAFAVVCSFAAPSVYASEEANHAIVTQLLTRPVPELAGKELEMITVEYPPGSIDPVHRHDAHAVVYVLEGTIVMQVKGGQEVTLKPGQTFYEGPNDVHTVGRNASKTQPAKFIVVLLKKQNAPILTVVE